MSFELFETIKKELNAYDLESVAEYAELSPETLRLWMNGGITRPRIDSLIAVAKVIDMVLVAQPAYGIGVGSNGQRHLRVVK